MHVFLCARMVCKVCLYESKAQFYLMCVGIKLVFPVSRRDVRRRAMFEDTVLGRILGTICLSLSLYLSVYLSIFHLSNYLSDCLSVYSPLLGLGRFFSFLIFYTVGRVPWTGDQPIARPLPAYRTSQTE
jgi:hypothetical protein